jgi:hypothetical protein
MFAHFRFPNSSNNNLANYTADIISVLTGETDKNNLVNTNLDIGNTFIQNTVPAGWTLWDSDTGVANRYVIRAPCKGDAAQYKYLVFNLYEASGYLQFTWYICTDWNTSTNTPTDATTTETNITAFRQSWSGDQDLQIFANEQCIVLQVTGTYGKTLFPIMEFSRNHPCFAVGQGYVPVISMHQPAMLGENANYAYCPRVIHGNGVQDITNANVAVSGSAMLHAPSEQDFFLNTNQNKHREVDADGQSYNFLQPIIVMYAAGVGCILGTSEVANLWWCQGDHATYNQMPGAEDIHGVLHQRGEQVTIRKYDNTQATVTPRWATLREYD